MKTIKNILIGFDDNSTAHITYDEEDKTYNFIIKHIVIFKSETLSEVFKKIELIYQ